MFTTLSVFTHHYLCRKPLLCTELKEKLYEWNSQKWFMLGKGFHLVIRMQPTHPMCFAYFLIAVAEVVEALDWNTNLPLNLFSLHNKNHATWSINGIPCCLFIYSSLLSNPCYWTVVKTTNSRQYYGVLISSSHVKREDQYCTYYSVKVKFCICKGENEMFLFLPT